MEKHLLGLSCFFPVAVSFIIVVNHNQLNSFVRLRLHMMLSYDQTTHHKSVDTAVTKL